VTLGGTVDDLSFPQHAVRRDVQAEQKHHVTLVTAHVRSEAYMERSEAAAESRAKEDVRTTGSRRWCRV